MNNDIEKFGQAKYIKAQQAPSDYSLYDPAPLFRKEIDIQSEINSAQVLVQSPGFACFYINGKAITQDIFISPVSDYSKLLWYNVYDVTTLLQPGKNVIGVIAGNGFFNESFDSAWHFSVAPWRDAPQFMLCLKINGEIALISDGTWRTTREKSHIIYNHLRSGEYVDMRKYDDLWLSSGYDDSDWDTAVERDTPVTGELRLTPCPPVREAEAIKPTAILKTETGYLVDFGTTISGYIGITLKAERGTEILFRYTEEIDEAKNPKYNEMDSPYFYPESPFHLNKLIASGKEDYFKPKFSYHGFRYVLIEGLQEPPISVTAYFTHQAVGRRSEFTCGNPLLNFIYNAGIRSTYANMFWSLTDCPTREKLGWANDAQASAEQALINFDIFPLYEKWFEDLKAAMREDGSLPGIIPSPGWGFNYGPMCDGLLYELPYRTYLYTGNAELMIGALAFFDRYAEYLEKKITEKHEFLLGDWKGYEDSDRIPKDFVAEFYLIKAFCVTSLAHELAGDDSTVWKQRLDRAKEQFLEKYLDNNGRAIIDEQSAIAMMLVEGLYRDKAILSDQLICAVSRDNMKITSGMVGIQYLYDALSIIGAPEVAYKLITESEPGYKTWYESGSDTLWENWEGRTSKNHHMFSNVIGWFFKSLLGIAPCKTSPGFEKIELNPCFIKAIGHVSGTIQTVRGTIEADWQYKDGHFLYTVTVPQEIEASFMGNALVAGKNQFIIEK